VKDLSQRLDEVDRKIIEVLQKDARIPFTEIGKELEVSDATVHFRVKKMLKAGIIKKYTIVVNESVYESRVSCYMLIKVKQGKIEEISRQLTGIERVNIVQEVHGSNDIFIKVGAMDLEGLRNAIIRIQENPKILTSEYLTILKTWKEQ
jgi:Lrp/AsnC family transcriptional regulator for asnA, asnC and gidA